MRFLNEDVELRLAFSLALFVLLISHTHGTLAAVIPCGCHSRSFLGMKGVDTSRMSVKKSGVACPSLARSGG
jgi:hypothetical protein